MAIIKILSRHTASYASLIRYILQEGKNERPEIITHNLRSETIDEYVKEFGENESFRRHTRKDQVYLFHEIISFHGSEHATDLSPSVMRDLSEEYIRLRGHKGVMLGAVHRDRDHVHLHLCVSALEFRTGKSFRLSKEQLRELKVSFQEYHRNRYPELSHSLPEHGKGGLYMKNRHWQAQNREKRAMLREQMKETVRRHFERSSSQTEFLELLRADGLHHYERNGSAAGIEHVDMKFRFGRLLEPGQFESLPIERREEERALADIRAIRAARNEQDRSSPEIDRGEW